MSCSGAFADAQDYAAMWCITVDDPEEEATVNAYLEIAASDIHAALAAVGACDCTLAGWAVGYLKKLNVIDAAIYHSCPCATPRISDERRESLLNWMNLQLDNIRTGKVELCASATGSEYPVIGWAEIAHTPWAQLEVIAHREMRNG